MELTIRTKKEPHKRFYCTNGSIYEKTYQEQLDKKTNRKILVPVGKKNVYEMIQADLEESKIENIIHKLAMNDFSVLKEAQLTYVDEKDFPHSLREAQDIVIRAKQEFDKFPAEVRKEFNNSPEQYVAEMGSDEFMKKMSPYNDEILKKQKTEEEAAYKAEVEKTAAFNKAVNEAMGGTE